MVKKSKEFQKKKWQHQLLMQMSQKATCYINIQATAAKEEETTI